MDMEKQSLVVIDKGKNCWIELLVLLKRIGIRGKSKGKSMNMQRNSLPTTRETTWKGNPANREGPRKVPWQRH